MKRRTEPAGSGVRSRGLSTNIRQSFYQRSAEVGSLSKVPRSSSRRLQPLPRTVFATAGAFALTLAVALSVDAATATVAALPPQDEYAVLGKVTGQPPPADMLAGYLKKQALAALDERDAAFENLPTPAQ